MPAFKLTIEMNELGQVSVNGPLQNKVLCYGLLGCAHDVIKDVNDKQSKIALPTSGDVLSLSRS
jgi:hypothetical protein